MAAPGGAVKAAPWKDPAARPYVEVERVSKSFGDFKAVDDVSLKIYKGEIFCLLGASGCGKTTLLRMLGGFETPTSGRIFIDGEDMTGVPPYARGDNMAVMYQHVQGKARVAKEVNVALPPTLSDVIMRAMAVDKNKRFQTMEELRTALEQFR